MVSRVLEPCVNLVKVVINLFIFFFKDLFSFSSWFILSLSSISMQAFLSNVSYLTSKHKQFFFNLLYFEHNFLNSSYKDSNASFNSSYVGLDSSSIDCILFLLLITMKRMFVTCSYSSLELESKSSLHMAFIAILWWRFFFLFWKSGQSTLICHVYCTCNIYGLSCLILIYFHPFWSLKIFYSHAFSLENFGIAL